MELGMTNYIIAIVDTSASTPYKTLNIDMWETSLEIQHRTNFKFNIGGNLIG